MKIKNSFKNQITALLIFTSLAISVSSCKKDNLEETNLNDPQTGELVAKDGAQPDTSSGVQSDSTAAGDQTQPTASAAQVQTAAASKQKAAAASQPKANAVQAQTANSPGITSNSYYLVNALPKGYVKDGSKDYTSYIQAAVTKYSNIVFPGFPILVNNNGIDIGSNKTITFLSGSEIRLKGSSKGTYNILNMSNVSNVTLYNPVIVGDRNAHSGKGDEWGMGIGMCGASNITIYSPKVSNCWGDGIYIGQSGGIGYCKNIVINGGTMKKNRRDGISIISVDGLVLDNIYAGYSDGTKPMTGINFEPNNISCELKDIQVNNPRTVNNGERGIQIVNRRMVGGNIKNTDITIVNHIDNGSKKNAFKFYCNPGSEKSGKVYGKIKIINPKWIKSSFRNIPMDISTNQENYKVTIASPKVIFLDGRLLSWSETYALLMNQSSRAPLEVIK